MKRSVEPGPEPDAVLVRFALVFVFFGTLVLRLLTGASALLHPEDALTNDSWLYRHVAQGLTQGRYLSVFRTPGYPLFLALTGGGLGHSPVLSLLAQVVLDAATAAGLGLIAFQLTRRINAAAWRERLGPCARWQPLCAPKSWASVGLYSSSWRR